MEHPGSNTSNQETYVQKCKPRIRKKKETTVDSTESYLSEKRITNWEISCLPGFKVLLVNSVNALQWGNYHGKVGYGVPKFCHVKSYLKKKKKRSDIVIDQKCRNYTKKDRFMTFPEVPIYHF